MARRWTIKQMNEIKSIDFAIEILHDRRHSLTNPYAPLNKKLLNTIADLRDLKEVKKRIVKLINCRIKEHEEQGCCTNYDRAMDELGKDVQNAFDYAYDCGRYEALNEILKEIEKEGKENG